MSADVCAAAAHDFAALGPTAAPLLAVVQAASGRDLADPLLVLDLLATGADAALVGCVLDHLRARAGGQTTTTRQAIEQYRASAFLVLAPTSQRTYATWLTRLDRAHGERAPRAVTTGDLVDLVQRHARRRVTNGRVRRVEGVAAARTAVTAYRHLWAYFADKAYADAEVAARLTAPPKAYGANRRAYTPAEAALARQLARAAPDPMLDSFVLLLAERALLRRAEICRLRFCDLDLTGETVDVWGKADRLDTVPLTPGLVAFLREYVESRRPRGVAPDIWRRSAEPMLRHGPSTARPLGRPLTRRYVEAMLARYRRLAPELYADGALCLHTYRHTAASWLEVPHGRSVAQAALRHRPNTPSAHYFPVPLDRLRDALADYERHLLSWRDSAAASGPLRAAIDL